MKDKIVLITGCSRGIGYAMTRQFARAGAMVIANAREEHCIDSYAEQLTSQLPGSVMPLYFDVTEKEACKQAVMQIKKTYGRLDALINNAGVMKDAYLEMVDDDTISSTFATNVYAVIHLTQYAVRLMKKQQSGSIVNLTSIVGINGNAGQTVYSASKGAVVALTKTWAKELAGNGIRVNAIAPGKIDTDMFRSIGTERVAASVEEIGFRRLGRPEEIADAAVYLCSDASSYVTGQILGVNGGLFM